MERIRRSSLITVWIAADISIFLVPELITKSWPSYIFWPTNMYVRGHWTRSRFLEKKEIDVLYYSGTDIYMLRDCGETHNTCEDGTVKAHDRRG